MKRLAIIGGGASGLAAAVAAGDALRRAAAAGDAAPIEVTVFESDDRVGRTVLATGNGRCNFSNSRLDRGDYRNADFVAETLSALRDLQMQQHGNPAEGALAEDPVREFFAGLGLVWREEDDGRLYPSTNKASTVLDVLRAAAAAGDVHEVCGSAVDRVEAPREAGGRFTLRMADGSFERADAVIAACGGRGAVGVRAGGANPLGELLPEGFASSPLHPVLGPLKTDTQEVRALDGVRVRCAVELRRGGGEAAKPGGPSPGGERGTPVAREAGELLFRSYGVSGIAVFNLSRHARRGDVLAIDLLPGMNLQEAEAFLNRRRKGMASRDMARTWADVLRGLVLPSLMPWVLRTAGARADDRFAKSDARCLAAALKNLHVAVEGIGDARQCQVMRGGLDVGEVDPRRMAVRRIPGLFCVGEALNVDAACGGYNLHWAWASGIVAGASAIGHLRESESR